MAVYCICMDAPFAGWSLRALARSWWTLPCRTHAVYRIFPQGGFFTYMRRLSYMLHTLHTYYIHTYIHTFLSVMDVHTLPSTHQGAGRVHILFALPSDFAAADS